MAAIGNSRVNRKIAWVGFLIATLVFAFIFTIASIYIIPVSEEFGIPRATFSFHTTINFIASIICSMFYSKLFRKLPVVPLMSFATILACGCFLAYSYATNIYHFYITSFVLGFCTVAFGGMGISLLVGRYCGESDGSSLGLALSGSGFGAMVFTPVYSRIIEMWGWRVSYRILAALVFVAMFAAIFLVIRKAVPADELIAARAGAEPETVKSPVKTGIHSSTTEYMKDCRTWLIALGILLMGVTGIVLNTTNYSFSVELGFGESNSALMVSLATAVLMLSKIIAGRAADKIGIPPVIIASCVLQIVGYLIDSFAGTASWLAVPGIIIYELGNHISTVGIPLVALEIFGEGAYPMVAGIFTAAVLIGNAIGPPVANALFDATGSYIPCLRLMIVVSIAVTVLFVMLFRKNRKSAG
ncbi:MAG: MFS transporter [Eubacterium sp.]|nr:MFS transporter [Eubacterium sp.]